MIFFFNGLGRLKTGSGRFRVDLHTGMGQAWDGLGTFGFGVLIGLGHVWGGLRVEWCKKCWLFNRGLGRFKTS